MYPRALRFALLAAVGGVLSAVTSAAAQQPLSTAFTYQGELASAGAPATGTFDIRFRLYDAPTGGTQIGGTLCSDDLAVTSGRFGVALDFGAVFAGQKRFMELEVRQDTGLGCADATDYAVLSPRQELTAAPSATLALTAIDAVNSASLGGQNAAFYSSAANLTGTLPPAALAGIYPAPVALSSPSNLFAGDGASITNLSATNISSGSLAAARMPADWAAGGDLSGFFPAPTINPGAVTLSKLAPSLRGVLSNFTALSPAPVPVDAIGWGSNSFDQLSIPVLPSGVTFTAASAGGFHALALRSDGAVSAWGWNNLQQTDVPQLPPGITFTSVAAGGYHSLAVRSDGEIAAWGYNLLGQLNVPALPAGLTYTSVAAGVYTSLAIRSDGTAVGWGPNDFGQVTVPALPPGLRYTALAAGLYHSVAVRSDGTIVVWGYSGEGLSAVPPLPPGISYTAVAAGDYHIVALRSDGALAAWGRNTNGQLNVPAGTNYTAVAVGWEHNIALRSDGTIAAWGSNASGQLNVPPPSPGITAYSVTSGGYFNLALRGTPVPTSVGTAAGLSIGSSTPPPASGGISVAGASSFAAGVSASSFTGDGAAITNLSATNISSGSLAAARMPTDWAASGDLSGFFPSPAINPGAVTLSKLSPSVQSVLNKLSLQTPAPTPLDAIAWGNNLFGQTTIPTLPQGLTYTALAGGSNHCLGLRSNGTVTAWGSNTAGQTNVPALPGGVTYTAVAASPLTSLALRSDGSIVAWGSNVSGLLNVPPLTPFVSYTAVSGGLYVGLALRSNGTVIGWGDNREGQLNIPPLPPGVTYTAIAVGGQHCMALRSDGNVVVWGFNGDGQASVPVLPPGVSYTAVASGDFHCLALRSDGIAVGWGFNGDGRADVPALLPGVTYTAVAAGRGHSLALQSNGAAVAWGYNNQGQTNIPGLPQGVAYTRLACGGDYSLALRGTIVPSSLSSALGVAASSFTGSGAALTNLSASNINTGTVSQSVLPVSAWTNPLLPTTAISSPTFTTMSGTSFTVLTRPGVAVVNWALTGRGTNVGSAYLFRVKAVTAGTSTVGAESVYFFNQAEVHTTIAGNAVVTIPAGGTTTFTLEVRRVLGTGSFNYDFNDSITGSIINLGQ